MQINFTLEDGIYVAETQADNAAVIQLERTEPGYIRIFRRMVGTMGWTKYRVWGRQTARESFVADLVSGAYPCEWRIESETAVTTARMDVQPSAATTSQVAVIQTHLDKLAGSTDNTPTKIDSMQEVADYLGEVPVGKTIGDTVEDGIKANTMTDEEYQAIRASIK